MLGYDFEKKLYELHRTRLNFESEIRFISFIEDYNSSFLFLIVYNNQI